MLGGLGGEERTRISTDMVAEQGRKGFVSVRGGEESPGGGGVEGNVEDVHGSGGLESLYGGRGGGRRYR